MSLLSSGFKIVFIELSQRFAFYRPDGELPAARQGQSSPGMCDVTIVTLYHLHTDNTQISSL